jgi:hypothetical protein
MVNWEAFGRKRPRPTEGTIMVFSSKDWGKQKENSVGISGVPVEIRTEHCRNAILNRCRTPSVGRMQSFSEFSSYFTGNKLRLRYIAQPVNAVYGNSRCLLWEPYGIHRYTVWAECRVLVYSVRTSQETNYVSATKPNPLMLFRKTVAFYCKNHTEHKNTFCGNNPGF